MITRQRLAWLGGIGGVLVVAVALLYLLVQKSKVDSTAGDPDVSEAHVSATSGGNRATTPVRPTLPTPVTGEAGQQPKVYTVGDVRVRDHRPGDPPPLDLPPNVHPPGARQLPSTLTADLGQQVRKVVRECAGDIPAGARGEAPKLEAQLTVAIDSHKLSIVNITSQVRDVEGAAGDAMRDCVARNAARLAVSAADQDDLANYGLRFSFVIPGARTSR